MQIALKMNKTQKLSDLINTALTDIQCIKTRVTDSSMITQNTHVQYAQTDTIRQTDGPLVPMVRLVPIEKHPIPMVLLVHMHLIKET